MLSEIKKRLLTVGWKVNNLGEEWAIAYPPLNQGITYFITVASEVPQALTPPLDNVIAPMHQIQTLVICPNGVSPKHLNQKHDKRVQFWFWDISNGNIFPSPPNSSREHVFLIIQALLSDSDDIKYNTMESKPIQTTRDNSFISKDFMLTYLIIAINAIIFFAMTLAGGTQNLYVLSIFGAKVNSLINEGQIWRLFTSMFIHIGIIHLAFNLYALWILGRLCEQLFGKFRYILIYILSGIGGALLSYLFSPAISAGASGAVFGILGSLLIYSLNKPQLWRSGLTGNLTAVIIANFIFGLIQPGIDNYAHFGGLLVGVISGILIFGPKRLPDLHKLSSSFREFFKRIRRQ